MVTMTWQLHVDKTVCGATGMCAALAPDLFQLNEAYAEPVNAEIEPDEVALDAADQCPTQAILVTENGKDIGPRP
jgi:ferredoxin